jgi:hypothetical protein
LLGERCSVIICHVLELNVLKSDEMVKITERLSRFIPVTAHDPYPCLNILMHALTFLLVDEDCVGQMYDSNNLKFSVSVVKAISGNPEQFVLPSVSKKV